MAGPGSVELRGGGVYTLDCHRGARAKGRVHNRGRKQGEHWEDNARGVEDRHTECGEGGCGGARVRGYRKGASVTIFCFFSGSGLQPEPEYPLTGYESHPLSFSFITSQFFSMKRMMEYRPESLLPLNLTVILSLPHSSSIKVPASPTA